MEQIKDEASLKLLGDASNNPSVPKVYANGFVSAVGNGDTILLFQQNGVPVLMLNLSFTLAKTLSIKLGNMIKDLESTSENTIMTTDDIQKFLTKMNG